MSSQQLLQCSLYLMSTLIPVYIGIIWLFDLMLLRFSTFIAVKSYESVSYNNCLVINDKLNIPTIFPSENN